MRAQRDKGERIQIMMRSACGPVFVLIRRSWIGGAAMMRASWSYAYGPSRVAETGALEQLSHLRKILDDRMLVLWAVGQRSEVIQGRKWGTGYARVDL
jgi:hypothetical protein